MNLERGDKVKLPINQLSYGGIKWKDSDLIDVLPTGQDYLYIRDRTGTMVAVSPSMSYNSGDIYAICRVYDLELYEEPLPEKWAIRMDNNEKRKEVCNWLNVTEDTTYFNPDK